MIVTELVFFSLITIVNTIIGRCYLCSQETLAECVGSHQSDSSIYINVLQYYTEPCNGQCVLFRNENRSIIRGCSWTYGHMTAKSIGWHEISPGIKGYFCNSHLCNNGTYDQPERTLMKTEFILSPEQLFLLAGSNPLPIPFGGYLSRQWHQCYSCTARFQGCGEFLNPHYASNYIRACPTSCIIFRNPNDLNLITRDCAIYWPQVHAKSGLHKLLGSDAFFCQESLCNGISFDFILGIFHHQLPAGITFPTTAEISTTTTNIYNDNVIWDDPDLDFVFVESTTPVVSNNLTNSSILTDDFDDIFPSNTTTIDDLAIENDTSLSLSSTILSSTIQIEEDNTTSILPVTRFEHLSINDHIDEINQTIENLEFNSDLDDDYPLSSTTPVIDFFTFIPYYFLNNQTNDQFFEYIKPAIPPFSWMLNMAFQNRTQLPNSPPTSTTTTPPPPPPPPTTSPPTTPPPSTTTTITTTPETYYEYCKNKPCHHAGRLNSDCLCICLPTFTGDNCETVLCDEEPGDICAFILEHECQMTHIHYLCPTFCQLDLCSSNRI